MPYCEDCGAEVSADASYCAECGATVDVHKSESPDDKESATGSQTASSNSDDSDTVESADSIDSQQTRTDTTADATWKHLSDSSVGKKLALGGGTATVIAAFLPWFSVDVFGTSVSRAGIDADGIFTLIFGLIIVGVIARSQLGNWGRKTWISVVSLGGLISLVGVAYISDPFLGVDQTVENAEALVNIEIGLYLTAIGGVLSLAGPLYDKYG